MEENIVYNKLDARGNVIGGIVLPAEFEDEAEGILECQKLTNWLFWEKRRELSEAEMAKAYLDSTDWYVVRFSETGVPIPEEVSAERAAARLVCPSQNTLNAVESVDSATAPTTESKQDTGAIAQTDIS